MHSSASSACTNGEQSGEGVDPGIMSGRADEEQPPGALALISADVQSASKWPRLSAGVSERTPTDGENVSGILWKGEKL